MMMTIIIITTATKKSTMSMDWGGGSTFLEEAVTNCNILHGVKKPKTIISTIKSVTA
jgi:hypothetical protein